jgi:serine/threonine protein kinase
VAIRVLPKTLTPDADARRALVATARAVSSLSHPNIITLFDAGEHDERVYLAFEFITGESLRTEMAGRPMPTRRALGIAINISDAIAAAHAAGFAHGGLSPESIMMTAKGHAKVPAFVLAAQGGFDQSNPEARLHDYISPEEERGEAPDDRSDVYSIGAILFELLTARRPSAKGAAAPSARNAYVPPDADAVVLKAIAPNPRSRHGSAAELAAELRRVNAATDAVGDEEADAPARGSSFGVVVTLALAVLMALAAWWLLRP